MRALWIGVAASLLILAVSPALVSAAAPFGPNVRVSDDPILSDEHRPTAVADATGNVFAAWSQTYNGNTNLHFAKSADAGRTWSASKRLGGDPPPGSTQERPSLAMGPNGELVVVWQDDRLTYFDFDIYASLSLDGGATFSAPTRVSDGPSGTLQLVPRVAVGAGGLVVVAWQDFRTGTGDVRASTATLTNFSFGPSVHVDDDTGTGTAAAPAVAVTSSENIYVAYHDNRSGSADVYLAKSSDGGLTYGASVRVDDTGTSLTPQGLVDIAVDGLGRIYAVWQDGRAGEVGADGLPLYDIYFAKSTDGGRTFSKNIQADDGPRKSSQETPRIAVGAAGTVYVVWDDSRNTDWDPYFSYSTDGGGTFSPSIRMDDAGDSQTNPPTQYTPMVVESRTGLVFGLWEDDRNVTADIYGTTGYFAVGSALAVRVTLDTDTAWPGDTTKITVRVTSNGTPVDGATISLAATVSGSIGAFTWVGSGTYRGSFASSPSTPDGTDVILTGTAQAPGYISGASQALLHVRKTIVASLSSTWDLLAVGQTMQVRASATAHGGPLPNATTLSGAPGGAMSPSGGLTDGAGNWSSWFTPANNSGGTNVTVSVAVNKSGYHPGTARVVIPILAQPRPLQVLETSATREMMSRERAVLRVELTSGGAGVTKAILTPFCVRGGIFSTVTELGGGIYAFSWEAPDVSSQTWVSLAVKVQRGGYSDATGKLAVLVDPNMTAPANPTQLFLFAYVSSSVAHAGQSLSVTVYAYTMQGFVVSGATLAVSVSGAMGTVTQPLDLLNGKYLFMYTAPTVTTTVWVYLKVVASKYGYAPGTARIALMLLP